MRSARAERARDASSGCGSQERQLVHRRPLRVHAVSLAVLTAVFALMCHMYGSIRYTDYTLSGMDLHRYRAMAQAAPGLASNVSRPFAYRILGPYLAGSLPLPDPVAFRLLAVVFSFSLMVLLYCFLCHSMIVPWVATVTTVLFLCSKYLFGFTLWDYFQVNDLLSLNYILILFWAMQVARWTVFGVVLLLGALTRETALVVAPVALLYLAERGRLRSEWKTLMLAALPGAVCFVLVRVLVVAPGTGLLEQFLAHARKLEGLRCLPNMLIHPFVPMLALPVVYWRPAARFFVQRPHQALFVGLVSLGALFGTDNERLMAPCFIVFFPLIAGIIQDCICPNRWLAAPRAAASARPGRRRIREALKTEWGAVVWEILASAAQRARCSTA